MKRRDSLIHSSWEEELFKYITGMVQNKGQKMIAINGMPDHIHILIGLKPSCSISELVREVKKSSNDFIQVKKYSQFKFSWQEGYGAFSYGHSNLGSVVSYIANQKEHHKQLSFKDEYTAFLKKFEIDHKPEYLFEWID